MSDDTNVGRAVVLLLAEFKTANDTFNKSFTKWDTAVKKNAPHNSVMLFHQKLKIAADRYNLVAATMASLAALAENESTKQAVLEALDNAIEQDNRDYPNR